MEILIYTPYILLTTICSYFIGHLMIRYLDPKGQCWQRPLNEHRRATESPKSSHENIKLPSPDF